MAGLQRRINILLEQIMGSHIGRARIFLGIKEGREERRMPEDNPL